MTNRIAILFCADRQVGIGHFKRCLILVENLKNAGLVADFEFINFRINEEVSIVEQYECPYSMWDFVQVNELKRKWHTYDAVICDLVIPKAYQTTLRFQQLGKYLSTQSANIILIDGVAETTFDPKLFTGTYRAVLQPYFIDESGKTRLDCSTYHGGPEFALVLRSHSSRTFTNRPKKILIATGATTTVTMAAYIFQSLSLTEEIIQKSVILHDPSAVDKSNDVNLALEVIPFDSAGLINVANSFDFVITSAGQSRYELIEANIPFAFFDWNKETQKASKIFSRNLVGRCIHLGLYEELPDFDFSISKVSEFCDEFNKIEKIDIFNCDENWKLLISAANLKKNKDKK